MHFSLLLSVESYESFHHNLLGCQCSACVGVMTTLHGSAPSFRRRAGGCVPSDGTIAFAMDLLKSTIPF